MLMPGGGVRLTRLGDMRNIISLSRYPCRPDKRSAIRHGLIIHPTARDTPGRFMPDDYTS